jgi:DNA-3-methyladenine glycosylase
VPSRLRPLGRAFYRRDALEVAPELLGKLLVRGRRRARLVEVEAYRGADDPASHAFRGPTPRNATMFGPPGHLYVYFSYGMHWCANVVCGEPGEAMAVLLRAAAPVAGLDELRAARPAARRDVDLLAGPGRLGQAMGFTRADDGVDLVRPRPGDPWLADDGTPPPPAATSPRIGLSVAQEHPWRWAVVGDPHRSRRG